MSRIHVGNAVLLYDEANGHRWFRFDAPWARVAAPQLICRPPKKGEEILKIYPLYLTGPAISGWKRLRRGKKRFSKDRSLENLVIWLLELGMTTPAEPHEAASGIDALAVAITQLGCDMATEQHRWTGPRPEDLNESCTELKQTVPPERWPYGPPDWHEDSCRLHSGGLYCDCEASDESAV